MNNNSLANTRPNGGNGSGSGFSSPPQNLFEEAIAAAQVSAAENEINIVFLSDITGSRRKTHLEMLETVRASFNEIPSSTKINFIFYEFSTNAKAVGGRVEGFKDPKEAAALMTTECRNGTTAYLDAINKVKKSGISPHMIVINGDTIGKPDKGLIHAICNWNRRDVPPVFIYHEPTAHSRKASIEGVSEFQEIADKTGGVYYMVGSRAKFKADLKEFYTSVVAYAVIKNIRAFIFDAMDEKCEATNRQIVHWAFKQEKDNGLLKQFAKFSDAIKTSIAKAIVAFKGQSDPNYVAGAFSDQSNMTPSEAAKIMVDSYDEVFGLIGPARPGPGTKDPKDYTL